MSRSISHYYSQAKGGLASINPEEMAELAEDMLIAGVAGTAIGFISANVSGLDKSFGSIPVPLDGLAAAGLGFASLSTGVKEFRTASIAAMGALSARQSEKFFKKAFSAAGEIEDGMENFEYGWGHESNDPVSLAAMGL